MRSAHWKGLALWRGRVRETRREMKALCMREWIRQAMKLTCFKRSTTMKYDTKWWNPFGWEFIVCLYRQSLGCLADYSANACGHLIDDWLIDVFTSCAICQKKKQQMWGKLYVESRRKIFRKISFVWKMFVTEADAREVTERWPIRSLTRLG